MFRTLYYLTQMGMLAALTILILHQGGSFDVTFGLYRVSGETPILVFLLLVILSVFLLVQRVWLWATDLPQRWRRYRRDARLKHGHRALVRSLTALVTGNYPVASREAKRAQKMLPEFIAVPTLLVATTAQKQDKPAEAQEALQTLLKTDARDLAVRGLVGSVLQAGDVPMALATARTALAQTPRVPVLARLVYDLECRMGEFSSALAAQKFLVRKGVLDKLDAARTKARLLTALARLDNKNALRLYRDAVAADPCFVPAVTELADLYVADNQVTRAQKILALGLGANPHPDLARRYARLAPDDTGARGLTRRWRYLDHMIKLAPVSSDVYLTLADCARVDGLWARAEEFLKQAEGQGATMRIYRAWAQLAEAMGNMPLAHDYLTRATNAAPDPVWYCTHTGKTFEQWEPLTLPEREFGTIIWGVPTVVPHSQSLSTLS